jgi:succinate dehydrogenase/fumarate reductase flavoprotein subunit
MVTGATPLDVVVLGTGASGLVAAIAAAEAGASVGLYERSDLVGGTTSMSGGIVWVPNNHHSRAAGLEDSREDALTYLGALSGGHLDSDLAAAFVDTGPEAIEWLEEHTPCRFFVVDGYPDYHPEHPGGKPGGGRSLDNEVFSFDELGPWADRIRNQRGLVPFTLSDTPLGGATAPPDPALIADREARHAQGLGLALVGALLRGCLDRGLEPHLGHRATELLFDGDRVAGVRFETPSGEADVAAATVILATGGFEWNDELVHTFLRGPMTAPASTPTNTGDGLVMAMAAGARLGNMGNAWWAPVTRIPGETAWGEPRVRLVLAERTRPRSLMVNRSGRRFCNEAGNYNALGGVFHTFDPATFSYPNQPCWLVFDHEHKRRYDVVGLPPGDDVPDWMISAATLGELAVRIDVPADVLEGTVARFNDHARAGEDPDFARGRSAYDHFNGDRSQPPPFTTLGPLDAPPFHALPIEVGSLGTNGGARTDARGRVLALRGGVIPGLYAAGNVMAAATGMAYGGAGGTLGPAITFGYIAGRDAAATALARARAARR